ncbi:MAG: hypothetical protein ACOWWM_04675 [Desulfobacterales bacterium]
MSEPIWIISRGATSEMPTTLMEREKVPKRVQEFRLSDLGYYLLSPKPIEVTGNLIGCKIRRHPGCPAPFRGIANAWKRLARKDPVEDEALSESWIAPELPDLQCLRDPSLLAHLRGIVDGLRPHHPLVKKLASLELQKVDDLVGLTEDPTGARTRLILKGDLEEKRHFLVENLLRKVSITLRSAYLADGLFELRGFSFSGFRPERSYRLIKFRRDGQERAAILGEKDRVDVHVTDMNRLRYVRIFQQAVRADPRMDERVRMWMKGEMVALKLFFNERISIDYSSSWPPRAFNGLFEDREISPTLRELVVHSLKQGQMGVSLSYLPLESAHKGRTCATVSVMHDVRAFEAVRKQDPWIYQEIHNLTGIRDNVPYYLLESITGTSDENRV